MNIGVYNEMRERMRGHYIASCTIRDPDFAYIIFEKNRADDEEEIPSMRVSHYDRMSDRKWGYQGFGNMYRALSVVVRSGNGELVVADFYGGVVSQEKGETKKFEVEDPLPKIRNVSILGLREIDGCAYAVGTFRTVFKRRGVNDWELLHGNDLALRDQQDKERREFGFRDISGFTSKDLYACGGHGDVWHYDGNKWRNIDVPTNKMLYSICCAGDGNVYIGGADGLLLVGRDAQWTELNGEQTTNTKVFNEILDLAWFNDQLFVGVSLQGIFVLTQGELATAPGITHFSAHEDASEVSQVLNERSAELLKMRGADERTIDLAALPVSIEGEGVPSPAAFHSFDTDGNLLIAGGGDTVIFYDGKSWRTLYFQFANDAAGSL